MRFSHIDTNSHPNFATFSADREEVIKRALEAGVCMNIVGTQKDTSKAAILLAEKYEGTYATVGLHPIHTSKSFHDMQELGKEGQEFPSRGEAFDFEYYKKLASHRKVVAIGECGLDYYRSKNYELGIMNVEREKQEETFRKHIELAIEVKKPLMLHLRNGTSRSAYKDAFSILKSYIINHTSGSSLRGNLHFFAGTTEEAKPFLDTGFMFSFTGVVTFARNYDEIIRYLPLGRILSETDCPYVAPAPYRGKRNEPFYVREVVKSIARIRNEDEEKARTQILKNAEKLFNISLA